MSIQAHFLAQSIRYIQMNPTRIKNCIDRLSEDQIWKQPNESSNSIANLMLHLEGNIRQYIVSGLGDQADVRERSLEFSSRSTYKSEQIFDKLSQTIEAACLVISKLDDQQLDRMYSIQGFELSGVEVVLHVTEHLSYHTGQIALLTKMYLNQDLGFYAGLDLDITK